MATSIQRSTWRFTSGITASASSPRCAVGFSATVWLIGSVFVRTAADVFFSRMPPSRTRIAEYGEDFPAFLAQWPGATAVPYLRQFAALEWQLARVSLAVDLPPVALVGRLHA